MSRNKKKSWFYWMNEKYRIVLMNDEIFQEERSLRLSSANVFSFLGLAFLLIGGFTLLLMILTPLGNLISRKTVDKEDSEIRASLLTMNHQLDSLQEALNNKQLYIASLTDVVFQRHETVEDATKAYEEKQDTSVKDRPKNEIPEKSKEVIALIRSLKEEIELGTWISNILSEELNVDQMHFTAPLKGIVTDSFAPTQQHYGTDVVAPEGTVIKAIQEGTVIVAMWSSDTGHVIGLQHDNNLISLYKHNSTLLKKMGDRIEAGEAIAIIGNTGEMTGAPHLHFELWYNQQALNPQNYVEF